MSKQFFLSPRNYILQKAKQLPIAECWIESEYKELGITNVFVVRQEPGGKFTTAVICVDLFCLGVKDAFVTAILMKSFMKILWQVFNLLH